MPSWEEVMREMKPHQDNIGILVPGLTSDELRRKYTALLSEHTGRNVIVYYSGWLAGLDDDVGVNDNDMTGFVNAMQGLDTSRGLDLILHTPGGDPNAAEAIVHYLHSQFGNDIRVIVPHMAMSAGTMISCAAKSILMAQHSALGPVDPQIGGIPAYNIVKEFQDAKEDIDQNPNAAHYWAIRLKKYLQAHAYLASDAIALANSLIGPWLRNYMFADYPKDQELKKRVDRIRDKLNSNNKSHGRHFNYDFCRKLGLRVAALEADPQMYDLVMGVHNACIIATQFFGVSKLIENQLGARYMTRQEGQGG